LACDLIGSTTEHVRFGLIGQDLADLGIHLPVMASCSQHFIVCRLRPILENAE
jgi:hypothetical protein